MTLFSHVLRDSPKETLFFLTFVAFFTSSIPAELITQSEKSLKLGCGNPRPLTELLQVERNELKFISVVGTGMISSSHSRSISLPKSDLFRELTNFMTNLQS